MADRFDTDAFEERAAICEFCAGMSRFDAETYAARQQGVDRWQALKFVKDEANANGCGLVGGHGHSARSLDGQRDAGAVPGMQPVAKEENGPVLERQPQAGWDRGSLPPLRMVGGEAV